MGTGATEKHPLFNGRRRHCRYRVSFRRRGRHDIVYIRVRNKGPVHPRRAVHGNWVNIFDIVLGYQHTRYPDTLTAEQRVRTETNIRRRHKTVIKVSPILRQALKG